MNLNHKEFHILTVLVCTRYIPCKPTYVPSTPNRIASNLVNLTLPLATGYVSLNRCLSTKREKRIKFRTDPYLHILLHCYILKKACKAKQI